VRVGPFALRHEPRVESGAYVLAGHIHPGITVRGPGRERLRLPCFAFGSRVGILPAFGEFTGTALTEPGPDDRIYVVAGDDVVQVDVARSGA
jgi:metallophosphoesterase superfamily enzyme